MHDFHGCDASCDGVEHVQLFGPSGEWLSKESVGVSCELKSSLVCWFLNSGFEEDSEFLNEGF